MIRISAFRANRMLTLRVYNDGPSLPADWERTHSGVGISNEILPKLFGKFVTLITGDEVNKHGTGLGLFITESIIQAHGGDIFAYNNEKGKGATFVIRLLIK